MYTHCTKENDKILGWYNVLDGEGDHHQDFDVLEGWKIYIHETTGAYMVDYTPVGYCIGSYKTEAEALQAICDRKNDDARRWDLIEKNQSKFVGVSLNEAYKDVNPVGVKAKKETPKSKYLDRLREKAKPYAKFQENLEKVKQLSARIKRKYYANQYDYLLEH